MKRIVLAYSGGLDTSVAVAWLRETHGVEGVTLSADVGGGSLRVGVAERVVASGAASAWVVGAHETLVADYVWPHLRAGALIELALCVDVRVHVRRAIEVAWRDDDGARRVALMERVDRRQRALGQLRPWRHHDERQHARAHPDAH